MAATLLLDRDTWDLVVDLSGNIAVASNPYSLAQDAASYVRTFEGEVYFDTTRGVPYWALILAKSPPISLVKARIADVAARVPEVVEAVCFIAALGQDRKLSGQVQVTDTKGRLAAAAF